MTSANTSAMLYQLSYEATHWEQGQFTEFISSRAVKSLKKIRASTGFEPMTSANTGAMLYQLSYEATHWEQGQFTEFIFRFHCTGRNELSKLTSLLPMCGFIAQLVEHRTGIRGGHGFESR